MTTQKFVLVPVALLTLILLGSNAFADGVTGDTYSIGLTSFFPDELDTGAVISHTSFPTVLTFSDTTDSDQFIHLVDDNFFGQTDVDGNALEEIIVRETLISNGVDGATESFSVFIDILAREKGTGGVGAGAELGTLTGIIAEGTTSDFDGDGTATVALSPLFDIGSDRFEFLGLEETLDISGPDVVLEGGEFALFNTDDLFFTLTTDAAGTPFDPTTAEGPASFSAETPTFAGLFDGDDASAFLLGGLPISGARITFNYSTTILIGDINGDGTVDLFDVSPFVSVLTSGEFVPAADINGDGMVDLFDVSPFVALLTSDGG